jgi:predicted nucleic acid-binding protein
VIFLDSNIFIALLNDDGASERGAKLQAALATAASQAPLATNLIVFAEVATGLAKPESLAATFEQLTVEIADLTPSIALRAAQAFREYRRRGGPRSTMLPDFLIAAHAATLGATLMTGDKRLASYFPELTFLTPETEHG